MDERRRLLGRAFSREGANEAVEEHLDPVTGEIVRLTPSQWALAEYDRLHFETCFYQGLDYALAAGLRRFDAGAQGEHKLIRGFEPVLTRSWHQLGHPGLRAAVDDFLAQERAGIRAYAEEARAALPYRQAE